jgi:hypothetical protein
MAVLDDARCAKFRQGLHDRLDLLQAENPTLTKAELKAGFQAIEDFWENNRIALKADIDTAMGRTPATKISNALAKQMGKIWLQWKWGVE